MSQETKEKRKEEKVKTGLLVLRPKTSATCETKLDFCRRAGQGPKENPFIRFWQAVIELNDVFAVYAWSLG